MKKPLPKNHILCCRVDEPTLIKCAKIAGPKNPNDFLLWLIEKEIKKPKYTGIYRKRYKSNWFKKLLPKLYKRLFKKKKNATQ